MSAVAVRWAGRGTSTASCWKRKTPFTDFVAVARHLVDSGVTRPQQLVALGGSAGGLLMGAVANMAPDLFAGILAQVPFVDPLTTILDPSLPLTVTEWDEWGNPLSDSDIYAYMKSYSPYENVADRPYPAILAMTSLNDTRVYYVEPAKWVAALRHTMTDGNSVLLKTQMSAGHGGISGRYERWKENRVPIRLAASRRRRRPLRRRPGRRSPPRCAGIAASSSTWRVRHSRRVDIGREHRQHQRQQTHRRRHPGGGH